MDTASTNPVRDAALAYAAKGWPVMAVDAATGAPLSLEPTTDRVAIIQAWIRQPLAAVAIVLGHGLVALRAPATATADRSLADMDERCGGPGRPQIHGLAESHWLYRYDGPRLANREVAPGVHLLGDGLVIMPPSLTPRGGEARWRKGEWYPHREPDQLPEWLHRLAVHSGEAPDASTDVRAAVPSGWESDLRHGKHGEVLNTFANVCRVLRCDARWSGRLSYSEMGYRPLLSGKPLAEDYVGVIREAMELSYGFSPSKENVRDAVLTVACERRFHPVRAYLRALKWDGVQRIDRFAREVLGLEAPTPLEMRVLRCFFLSAVARALRPGCKVDTVLVLVGAQGLRKSTLFRVLAGDDWFSDSHMDLSSKDRFLQIAEAWIYEWGELGKIVGKRNADEIKALVTSPTDLFRPPYAERVARYARSGVFVGTTNDDEFLQDSTGSRRFHPIRVPGAIAIDVAAAWRDQLWAEAVAAVEGGEAWHLEEEHERARVAHSETFRVSHPWEECVTEWLRGRWPALRAERRARREMARLTTVEVLRGALRLDPRDMDQARMNKCAEVLRLIGLEKRRARLTTDEAAWWKATTGKDQSLVWEWIDRSGNEVGDVPPDTSGEEWNTE